MKTRLRTIAFATLLPALAINLQDHALAAQWSGGGADLDWSTLGNWTNNTLPSATADAFFVGGDYPISTNAQGAVNNIVNNNFTVRTLNYSALATGSNHTTQINSGQTLSVVGVKTNTIGIYTSPDALFVGTGVESGSAAQVYATITGPGTLLVSNTAANVDVTQTSGTNGNKMATLDLSGLNAFTANVSQVRVGNGNSSGAAGTNTFIGNMAGGTLLLAKTNVIVCSSTSYGLSLSDNPQNIGPASFMRLGQSNAFFSDFGIAVGRRKSGTTAVLSFAPGLVSPTALFRNKAGTGAMGTWVIGDNFEQGSIGSSTSGLADFTGGTVDALVGTVYLGRTYNSANGTGNALSTGVLTLDAGTIIVTNTMEVGYQNSFSGARAAGTVNVLSGGLLVVSNDLRLARFAGTTNTGSATGTLNITGGRVLVGGNLVNGGGTTTLAMTGGFLDMQPPGDLVPGTINVGTIVLDGMITNAPSIVCTNGFTITYAGVLAGNTNINIGPNGTFDVSQQGNGYLLSSGQMFQGAGIVNGALVQSPGATISPGGAGVPGALTVYSSLTLSNAGNLIWDLSNDPTGTIATNDLITVYGSLDLEGTNSMLLKPLGADFVDGTYKLFDAFGGVIGSGDYFQVAGPVATSRRTFTFDTSAGNAVNLIVAGTAPGTLVWAGDGTANNWDLKTTADWLNGGTPDRFYSLDAVVFDDTGSVSPAVNLVGTLIPGSMTVSNETKNYTFGGSGSLSGTGGLTKQGAGLLALANTGSNDFTGPVTVAGGTLQIGSAANPLWTNAAVTLSNTAGALLNLNSLNLTIGSLAGGGSAGGNVTLGSGTLTINGSGSGVYGGVISDSGRLVMSGTGTLQLIAPNLYTGGTLINTGTVVVANANGSGLGSGGLLIAGGTLQLGTNGTTGSIAPQPGGYITNHGILSYNHSDTLTPVEIITGNGGVRQAGSGTVIFNHDNSYTNTTTVNNNNGVLRITSPYALGTLDGGTTVAGGNVPPPGTGGQLEMAGNVVFAPERLTLGCRGTNTLVWNVPSGFVNSSGTNTWTGPIDITTGGSYIAIQSDSGLMRIAGSVSGGPTSTSTRMAVFRGAGDGEVSGVISNGPVTTALSISKGDSGTWTFAATNLYTGATLVTNSGTLLVNGVVGGSGVNVVGGTLGGTGLITAPITIGAAGTLSPGVSVGTLTVSNNLTCAGNLRIEVNKSLAQSNDFVIVSGVLTNSGTGTIAVTNLGPSLVTGDSFKLLNKPMLNGGALQITAAGGVVWTNKLAVDGTIQVLSAPVNTPPGFPPGAVSRMVDGNISLTVTGAVGQAYSVRASTNVALPIAGWTLLTNGTVPSSPFTFSDLTATNYLERFYLLSTP